MYVCMYVYVGKTFLSVVFCASKLFIESVDLGQLGGVEKESKATGLCMERFIQSGIYIHIYTLLHTGIFSHIHIHI